MTHGHTQTHKTHHDPDLGEATTFPLILLFVINHEGYIQMSFCPETPTLGLPQLWKAINFCIDLWLMWGLKKSYSLCWELSIDMWHNTCTQVNQGNSRLLMVKSQIDILPPDLSFGHNLCFKYSNGTCKLILDIYVPRAFEWYKGLFNPMSFDPCNWFLKIQESIETPTPKVGTHLGLSFRLLGVREWTHLGMCGFVPSHPPTLSGSWNVILGLHSQLAPL